METFEIVVKIGVGVGGVLALLSIGILLALVTITAIKRLINNKNLWDD